MKIKVVNSSPILPVGKHQVKISKVYKATAKTGSEQLAVLFVAEDGGKFTNWFNLQGFKRDPKEPTKVDENGYKRPNYLTDKKGERIVDEEATLLCEEIIGKLMFHAGCEEGDELDPMKALEGKSVTIAIRSENKGLGQRDVLHYTAPARETSDVDILV